MKMRGEFGIWKPKYSKLNAIKIVWLHQARDTRDTQTNTHDMI